jgi:hypothetical protein
MFHSRDLHIIPLISKVFSEINETVYGDYGCGAQKTEAKITGG